MSESLNKQEYLGSPRVAQPSIWKLQFSLRSLMIGVALACGATETGEHANSMYENHQNTSRARAAAADLWKYAHDGFSDADNIARMEWYLESNNLSPLQIRDLTQNSKWSRLTPWKIEQRKEELRQEGEEIRTMAELLDNHGV